jgi:hypothetical protein
MTNYLPRIGLILCIFSQGDLGEEVSYCQIFVKEWAENVAGLANHAVLRPSSKNSMHISSLDSRLPRFKFLEPAALISGALR